MLTHTVEKLNEYDICQKSFSQSSHLARHCISSPHLKRKESKNTDLPDHRNIFIDCGRAIKVEDSNAEIKEEESVEDPLSYSSGD